MIALIAASAMYLAASQAALTAPTTSFKDCLKQASVKAKSDKVSGDGYEAYARNACSAQLAGLTNAITAFNVKNGMKRKDAADDADLTAGDYLASSVDTYKFMAGVNDDNAKKETEAKEKAAAAAAAAAAKPAAVPASAPQPPK